MSIFFPGEYLDSTYVIDFDKLYQDGYRAVIFDVDNTLVPHGEPADERAKELFAHLKELGYSCMLLSNNKEPRVKMFNDVVQVNYIFKATFIILVLYSGIVNQENSKDTNNQHRRSDNKENNRPALALR